MPAFNKFNIFTKDLIDGKHNFASNTFKVALTNTLPVAANTVLANITQITAQNGYASGGPAVTVATSTATGVAKVTATDTVITASGAIGPFRYMVLYNDTTAGKPLIGWVDHGSAVTMANLDTHTVDFNGADGLFTV